MPAIAALAALLLVPGGLLPWPGGGEPQAATPSAAVLRAEPLGAGVVLGDAVNLRSGPGTAYEVVGKLGGGERVTILGEAFGWLLVRPANDLKVFVSKELLEKKGPGVAVVRRDRVNLRSRPALDGTILGQVGKGELVRVLDDGVPESEEYTAVSAPPEVAVYVHRDLVRVVDAAASDGATTVAAGAAKAEEKAAAPTPPLAEPPPAAATPRAPTPAEKALRARDLYLAELEKADLGAMDFRAAQALDEQALREATNEETRAAARVGLKRLKIAIALQEDYRRRMRAMERVVGEGGDPEPCGK